MSGKSIPIEIRFWKKVNKNGPIPDCQPSLGRCWIWTAALFKSGYGAIRYNGQTTCAHVISLVLHNRTIPKKHDVHHLCHTKRCVNPSHIKPLTRKKHAREHPKKLKSFCKRGHPRVPGNLYYYSSGSACRICCLISAKKQRANRSA